MNLTESQEQLIFDLAQYLNTNTSWLRSLIYFESQFDPAAKNPYSGARGIIQFTNTTARDLGYLDADHLFRSHPTFESQITGPVKKYFDQFNKPLETKQKLYMSVFFPSYMYVDPYTEFPDYVKAGNPGIEKPIDYIRKVDFFFTEIKF